MVDQASAEHGEFPTIKDVVITPDVAAMAEVICHLHARRRITTFKRKELNYRWQARTSAPVDACSDRTQGAYRRLAKLAAIYRERDYIVLLDRELLEHIARTGEPQ